MRAFFTFCYQWFVFIPLLILITIITALVVMIGCLLGNNKYWSYAPPRCWSKLVCRLALCRITVKNEGDLDPEKSYVFVANHQSAFDIFLIYGYLGHNIKWVQKSSLRNIPFVGKASEIAGHVYVDYSSPLTMKSTIDKVENELSKGVSMAIFPEGARAKLGRMGKFKKGAFIIAYETKLPIVPLTLNGPYNVLKIGSLTMNLGQRMELVIHEPIPTNNIANEDVLALMDNTREVIESSLWDVYK